MTTFTRLLDDETFTPDTVRGPFEISREARNIVRPLLQSSATRITYVPPSHREGEYRIMCASHAAAVTAQSFFLERSEYTVDAVGSSLYAWVDGYYLPAEPEDTDESYTTRFTVTDGGLRIVQNTDIGYWVLTVPYKETPA